jgi:hypothetical protein
MGSKTLALRARRLNNVTFSSPASRAGKWTTLGELVEGEDADRVRRWWLGMCGALEEDLREDLRGLLLGSRRTGVLAARGRGEEEIVGAL